MKTKIIPIFFFSFIISCAQTAKEHAQNNFLAPDKSTEALNNNSIDADTANGLIMPTGKMQTARAAHTATLLESGQVLISGGFAGSATLSSTEIYDPTLKTFAFVEQMSIARSGHTATLLPNGQLFIAGGYNGDYLSSTEIFDPQTKTFSAGPQMNSPRSDHTATVLNNGKILFAGGVGTGWSFLESAELYDIQTKTFTPTNSMTTARESHTATLLKNGSILITGGHKGRRQNIEIYSSAELYNPVSAKFKLIGSMSIIRHKHDAIRLPDGKVLITGGSDERDSKGAYRSTELYDPASSSINPAGNMHLARYKHNGTSVLLSNGNVLFAGGANRAEIYQTGSGSFGLVNGSMGTRRLFSTASLLKNGEVLITGGYNENIEASSSAWIYTSGN